MFRTIFWEVPAFNRVEPVKTSGPTSGVIEMFTARASGDLRLAVKPTVNARFWFAYPIAAST